MKKPLNPLQFTSEELRQQAVFRERKMSIQGVQNKLSAVLNAKTQSFDIVDTGGTYILKMQSASYPELPQNEDLTMSLAKTIGLEVPEHGLITGVDNQFTYYIKRFDRLSKHRKLAVEDFAQLTEASRDTKYGSSMEKVALVIQQFCSYPKVEAMKLFKLTVFNFLVGNEDMHLKNFSLITKNGIVAMSPVYDLLNSSIAIGNFKEEIALPIDGKKKNLTKKLFCDYYAKQRLGLNDKVINEILTSIESKLPLWQTMINESALSSKMKLAYLNLLKDRAKCFGWSIF